MKRVVVLFSLIACAAFAQTEQFDLVGPDGKKIGPFQFRDGQSIRFGDKIYKIQIRRKAKVSIAKKLYSIRIAEMSFRETDIRDILEFLRVAAQTNDPEKIGINIVLMPGQLETPADGVVRKPVYPKLTMNLRDVTIVEVMNLIKASTGYTFRVQDSAVAVYPKTR